MGKKSRFRSGIWIQDEHPGSYFRELRNNFKGSESRIRNLFDPGPWIRDPGSVMEKFGSGGVAEPRCLSRIRNTAFIYLFLR
jgi:hypothetical protein